MRDQIKTVLINDHCPMCGKEKQSEYEDQIEKKTRQNEMMDAFLAGRRSWAKFSRRENDVFDAYYDLGMTDFRDIARNYGIEKSTIETYYDRMMDKLINILDEEIF